MKKKILFVVNSMELGGAEKSLTSLLSTINFEKYEVDLLMFNPKGVFLKLLPKEVNILPRLNYFNSINNPVKLLFKPQYLFSRIRASVKLRQNDRNRELHPAQCYWKYTGKYFDSIKQKYDVAIAWGQGNPTHYVIEKVDAKKKIAFINADYENVGHNKSFDFIYYKSYDYIAAVSDELYQKLLTVFPDFEKKILTIYDINNAELINKMADERNPFKDLSCQFILVTVGRLVSQKGYELAIEAGRVLNERNIDFKWFFVGDGVCREELEKQIAEYKLGDRIIITGLKENPYVYMKNADIYVQTSKYEGYCLAVCEARILNKPIVSTNFDVVYNQLSNGVNGLIVEMNGLEIANAIEKLLYNDELQNKITTNLKKEKKGNIDEIQKLYALIDGR